MALEQIRGENADAVGSLVARRRAPRDADGRASLPRQPRCRGDAGDPSRRSAAARRDEWRGDGPADHRAPPAGKESRRALSERPAFAGGPRAGLRIGASSRPFGTRAQERIVGRTRDVTRREGGLVESVRRAAFLEMDGRCVDAGADRGGRLVCRESIRGGACRDPTCRRAAAGQSHGRSGARPFRGRHALRVERGAVEDQGLAVHSRQSVLRYRDSERPLPEIARELGWTRCWRAPSSRAATACGSRFSSCARGPSRCLRRRTPGRSIMRSCCTTSWREIADSVHARLAPADARARRAAKRDVNPAAEKAFLPGCITSSGP